MTTQELKLKQDLETGFQLELSSECGNVFEARFESRLGKFMLVKNGELLKSEKSFERMLGSLSLGSLTETDRF
tara:strand:- start:102 stop:320 length:219 start_codon:yes stop_codon:yes gene_type:complete